MLGGEMQLISEPGKGTTFYVFLPLDYLELKSKEANETVQAKVTLPQKNKTGNANKTYTNDDRNLITENDKILLIVEDDIRFANILFDMAHERNLKAIIATDGNEGLQYAEQYNPSAIILDMQLPEMNGWSLLDRLKANEHLNGIPIHIMSAMDKEQLGIDMGATAYLRKPLDKKDLDEAFTTINNSIETSLRHVLLIEDVRIHQEIVSNLLKAHHRNIEVNTASTVSHAESMLLHHNIDCIVLDLDLGNGPEEGLSFLAKLKSDSTFSEIPVIIFTGSELNTEAEEKIRSLSAKLISKNGRSFDSLIEETEKFLHKIIGEDGIPSPPDYLCEILRDKTVLIADDDMRNIYALTSILEAQGMKIVAAGNGIEAMKKLEETPETNIILMDIMMPEMDGYQAMKEIKNSTKYCRIPIIAVTAKAMVGDREKCLQCGASDYISKPVNTDQLLSLMRVWLYQEKTT